MAIASPRDRNPSKPADAARTSPASRASGLSPAKGDVPSRLISDLLVDAIEQVESGGNPRCVGRAGERGIMQIKRETWNHVTRRMFGQRVPFDQAFDPELNDKVARAYLAEIQDILYQHRSRWKADERALLLACYNAGPNAVKAAGFDLRGVPRHTRGYVERVTALHDVYLAQVGVKIPEFAAATLPPRS
jgi:soluble lytic murein transglycosylase-like protein